MIGYFNSIPCTYTGNLEHKIVMEKYFSFVERFEYEMEELFHCYEIMIPYDKIINIMQSYYIYISATVILISAK